MKRYLLIFFILQFTSIFPETLKFNIRSEYPYVVSVAFYSQNRDKVWPSKSEVWMLKDSLTHTYTIECQENEIVCYGAWVRNESSNYWGVGYEGKNYCESCCYKCNGASTPIIELKSKNSEI